MYRKGPATIAIWLHVDDGLVVGNNLSELDLLRKRLEKRVKIKWEESCNQIVGVNLHYTANILHLDQSLLIDQIVKKWQSTSNTALLTSTTTLPHQPLTTPAKSDPVDANIYQSFIGSLNYVALGTRPNISFAVNYLSRYSNCLLDEHWLALHHLIRYVNTSKARKLTFRPKSDGLQLWVNADWGGEFHRSTSGFLVLLNHCPVSWGLKRQKTIATSTCNAEFIALGMAMELFVSLRAVCLDFDSSFSSHIFCDNRTAVLVATENGSRSRMKHISRNFFFINDLIRDFNL